MVGYMYELIKSQIKSNQTHTPRSD
jgi:hypothetical protein